MPSPAGTPVPIKIDDATFTNDDGDDMHGVITGKATIEKPEQPPDVGDAHPEHPILTPPEAPEGSFYVLAFCPNPPPPHWEWILMTPGSPPQRPHPEPPEPPTEGEGLPEKEFPEDGGWGYKEPWGWIYWPGPEGATPKGRR